MVILGKDGDISTNLNSCSKPEQIVEELRRKIKVVTGGCTASAGIAKCKLLAKMATDHSKKTYGPDTQYSLFDLSSSCSSFKNENEKIKSFMSTKKLRDIPGIGWEQSSKLSEEGLTSVDEFLRLAESDSEFHSLSNSSTRFDNSIDFKVTL